MTGRECVLCDSCEQRPAIVVCEFLDDFSATLLCQSCASELFRLPAELRVDVLLTPVAA